MGFIKTIILWIIIFVIGSLIVSFIINPNSFDNFKSNIKSIIPQSINQDKIPVNTVQLAVPSNILSCPAVRVMSSGNGISYDEGFKMSCVQICSSSQKIYYNYKCVNEQLICLCS